MATNANLPLLVESFVDPTEFNFCGRAQYMLHDDVEGDAYGTLLEYAFETCDRFLLHRTDTYWPDQAQHLADLLMPSLIGQRRAYAWPGTVRGRAELPYGAASPDEGCVISEYRGVAAAKAALRSVRRLMGFEGLEDLTLLRPDDTPWLTTISHEGLAWFALTSQEKSALLDAIPALEPLLQVGSGLPYSPGPYAHRGVLWLGVRDELPL